VQDLKDECPELNRCIKLEAAWILTNIAYGEEEPLFQLLQEASLANCIKGILKAKPYDLVMLD